MIPNAIHYCWVGRGPKSKKIEHCIASWRKYCPDYQIIEWNEDNFDVNRNGYTRMCYEQRKFAFLSDYVRLLVLEQQGGFYFDTDVEVVRPIDALCNHKAFIGFETDYYVNTGQGFGCEAHNPAIRAMLAAYDDFLDGSQGTQGCPILNTRALEGFGLVHNGEYQDLGAISVYPRDYFNPYDAPTGRLFQTPNTYSIHWYAKSWMKKRTILRSYLMKPVHRLFQRIGLRK